MTTLRCPYCRVPRLVESVVLARTRRNRGVITLGCGHAGEVPASLIVCKWLERRYGWRNNRDDEQ